MAKKTRRPSAKDLKRAADNLAVQNSNGKPRGPRRGYKQEKVDMTIGK